MQAKNELPSLLRAPLARDHPETDFDPQKYRPRCAKDAEKLRLLGATREELRRWFGVHELFLEAGPVSTRTSPRRCRSSLLRRSGSSRTLG